MRDVILHLNYLAVFVTAVAGFMLGWLWYSVLFGKAWMAEMKITEEMVAAIRAQGGMAGSLAGGFAFTVISTFGLAALIAAHDSHNWKHGAALGLFIGCVVAGARILNGGVFERKSAKLQIINLGHELALFAVQGAILGVWR